MAQTIKIKRGGIQSLVTSTPTLAQGELVLATGSLNGLGSTFFVATASNSPSLPYAKIESITDGTALAGNIDDNFTGLLIHSASDNKFYRFNGSAFVELPVAAGSFVGTLPVTSGGTGLDTIADNSVLVSTAADTLSAVDLSTNGALLVGGTTTGPAAVAPATLGGDGIAATGDDGSLVLSVQNLNDTITVAEGGISVNTGSISSGGNNLVDAGTLYTLSSSIASDIVANTGNVEGAIGQVAYFESTNAVSGSTGFTFSNNVLTVSGSTFSKDVVISGDLIVNGTTTTINTTELNIEDNIIVVNYGGSETEAGIYAIDNVSTTGTGSLLWDGTNDWWKAGVKSSEKRVVTFDANSGGTENNIQKLDADSYLVDSNITDASGVVTIASDVDLTLTGTGQLTAPDAVIFSGLTGATNDTSAQVAFVDSTGKLGEIPTSIDTSATATGFLGYSSDNVLEFVSTIDGGTF